MKASNRNVKENKENKGQIQTRTTNFKINKFKGLPICSGLVIIMKEAGRDLHYFSKKIAPEFIDNG